MTTTLSRFTPILNSNAQAAIEQARAFVTGDLTDAERSTVELLVREGLSNAEIAARRSVSARTVENQIRTAAEHIGVSVPCRGRN